MLTATHGDSHAMLGISHVSPEKKRKCSEVGSQKGKRENTCPLSFLSQTFPEVVLNLVHTSGCNWFLCRILESQDVGPIERHELMVSLLTLQLHKSLVNFFPMCILMISVTSDLTNSAFFSGVLCSVKGNLFVQVEYMLQVKWVFFRQKLALE